MAKLKACVGASPHQVCLYLHHAPSLTAHPVTATGFACVRCNPNNHSGNSRTVLTAPLLYMPVYPAPSVLSLST